MRLTTPIRVKPVLLLAAAAVTLTGCQQHMVDPWTDELAGMTGVTTPSVVGYRLAPRKETLEPRHFEPTPVEPQDGTVAHWPLWWQDPFEDKGSNDGKFAVTAEDYFYVAYGPARFILNTMAFPVSAWVTKPFTVMCSDGKLSQQALGYDHDPIPCSGGTAPPIDVLELETYHETEPPPSQDTPPQPAPPTSDGEVSIQPA